MWSNVKHKTTFTDHPEVIDALREYIKLNPVTEQRPGAGSVCQTLNYWRKRTIEEFLSVYSPVKPVVKVVDISILTEDTYQITYYLKGKLEGRNIGSPQDIYLESLGKISSCFVQLDLISLLLIRMRMILLMRMTFKERGDNPSLLYIADLLRRSFNRTLFRLFHSY